MPDTDAVSTHTHPRRVGRKGHDDVAVASVDLRPTVKARMDLSQAALPWLRRRGHFGGSYISCATHDPPYCARELPQRGATAAHAVDRDLTHKFTRGARAVRP